MRILLIATNRHSKFMNRLSAQPAPIGLAYIGGHLDSKKHDVKILDLMFSDDYLEETEKSVREFHPDLIGISLRNLDNVSYIDPQWALPVTKEIIEKVRSISDAPIVCGGAGFSLLPEACFEYLEPNLGIAGDGGESFAQLADSLGSGETYTNLPGLVYRDVNGTVLRKGLAYSDYTEPPLLDQLDLARYDKAGFGIGIVTKLDSALFNSRKDENRNRGWRVLRPIEEVIEDIRDMKDRFNLRKIFFIDSSFNVPLPHAKALCQSMLEADLKVRWNSFMAPVPEACDEEVLGLMKEAGSALVIMTDSAKGSLYDIDVESRLAPVREACERCDRTGIRYVISQKFGEPGETSDTVEAKLAFLRQIKPALANLRVGVRIMPNSPVADSALKEGLITDESDLIRPYFYIAEPVRDWIVDRLQAEAEANPRWNVV